MNLVFRSLLFCENRCCVYDFADSIRQVECAIYYSVHCSNSSYHTSCIQNVQILDRLLDCFNLRTSNPARSFYRRTCAFHSLG